MFYPYTLTSTPFNLPFYPSHPPAYHSTHPATLLDVSLILPKHSLLAELQFDTKHDILPTNLENFWFWDFELGCGGDCRRRIRDAVTHALMGGALGSDYRSFGLSGSAERCWSAFEEGWHTRWIVFEIRAKWRQFQIFEKYSYKIYFLRYWIEIFGIWLAFLYCIYIRYNISKKWIYWTKNTKFWVWPPFSKIYMVEPMDSNF